MSESDPILVSYQDSIVRLSNLKTLDKSNWLDDNIITFAFEYLQYESKFTKDKKNLFAFVTPPVVQLLKMSDDLFAEQLLQSIDFLEKKFLILPINDNTHVTVFGGSHWSLLIFSIQGRISKRKDFFVDKDFLQKKFCIILIQCYYQMIVRQKNFKKNFK
jgi:Ulp1 family protease